ncbi:MAG: hypothetical protein P1V51_10400 [Deltaproteobacteria bacterium]|nr:hypothetical protein [Deltaproteobacteria bacterium]
MAREPRLSGELVIPEEIRAALAELRLIHGIDAVAELCLDEVRALERAIQHRFPDALLALLAAHLKPLVHAYELDLDKVMALSGRVHALGGRGDLVAFAKDPADGRYLCWVKGEPREPLPLLLFEPGTRASSSTTLPEVLAEWIATHRQLHPDAPRFEAGLAATFHPRTVMPLPGGSDGRRVRHAKFGEGRVLLESGSGPTRKVKVDFPGHGLKHLQARFLTYLDEEEA